MEHKSVSQLSFNSILHKLRVIAERLEFNDDEDEEPYGKLIDVQMDEIEETARKRIDGTSEDLEYANTMRINEDAMLALVGYYRNNQLAIKEIMDARKRLNEWGERNL
jgi:hypothetical protein